jgi:hypothetical protein
MHEAWNSLRMQRWDIVPAIFFVLLLNYAADAPFGRATRQTTHGQMGPTRTVLLSSYGLSISRLP